MFVFGPGIQAGTTVSAVNVGAGTITLSLVTTISAFQMGMAFMSMKNLHMFPCTITVTGATTYQLNVDTTSFGTFATAPDRPRSTSPFKLEAAAIERLIRACSTALLSPCRILAPRFCNRTIIRRGISTKTVAGKTDGAGNWVFGAWLMSRDNSNFNILQGHWGEFPIEVCVALVNELNAMSLAQGKPNTIGLWLNIPTMGLSTMDPDYTMASDWAVNAVDVVMNPNSAVRVGGFSALGYSGSTQT